jgi:hypothetical protein
VAQCRRIASARNRLAFQLNAIRGYSNAFLVVNARFKITLIAAILAIVAVFFWLARPSQSQRALENTRRYLKKQGFKTDLTDFNFETTPDEKVRAAILAKTTLAALKDRSRFDPRAVALPILLIPASADTALVTWQQQKLRPGIDVWPELRESLMTNHAFFDRVRQAAISGPIRFEPINNRSTKALLPYLADLKQLESAFAALTVLSLHDGQKDAAWTNLLGTTCLVTAYEPEPIDTSHLVRFACANIAYEATWNALQSHTWTEAQLAELQRQWTSVDFWRGLPDTAAFARADLAGTCREDRESPVEIEPMLKTFIRSPRQAWDALKCYPQMLGYRRSGSFEDEQALLLYFRDRELELRTAIQASTWSEMSTLPGVTNVALFTSKHPSPLLARMNLQRIMLSVGGDGGSLLSRAAEAYVRRMILITALSLERYRLRHAGYPQFLKDLVPELLYSAPKDFMDGNPLRYRPNADLDAFILYSVGLDGIDNGGTMKKKSFSAASGIGTRSGQAKGTDLVWPRPASLAEAEHARNEQFGFQKSIVDRREQLQANAQWDETATRAAQVETILQASQRLAANQLSSQSRLPAELLRNEEFTNEFSRGNILALHQIITGTEPELITFELPVSYDVLTNIGQLQLYVDPVPDPDSELGNSAQQVECRRATNGNCQLSWNTIYEAPGKHALQAAMLISDRRESSPREFNGPFKSFIITNLCQFSLTSAQFEHDFGVTLRARLAESNGNYVIELKSFSGKTLKTISGGTSNAIVEAHWDLKDDAGNIYTNNEFDTRVHISLPASGRSQLLKGP